MIEENSQKQSETAAYTSVINPVVITLLVPHFLLQTPAEASSDVYHLVEKTSEDSYFLHENFIWKENGTRLYNSTKAFLVRSDGHVNVQTGLHAYKSSDVMRVLPLTTSSTEFYVPSYQTYNDSSYNLRSVFLVVSKYNDNCVEATYHNDTGPYLIESQCLAELEVWEKMAAHGDFTGVYINSTHPITVIGGHECAYIPTDKKFCDLIMDAAPPLAEWGKEFIVGPILGRRYSGVGHVIRVVAGYDHTEMEVVGGGSELAYTRDRGKYIEIGVTNNEQHIMTVTCSNACMVVQYNKGIYAYRDDDFQTDPFMMVITPIDHFTNDMTFSTPWDVDEEGNLQTMRNFLTVVAPDDSRSDILLNGQRISTITHTGWIGQKLGHYSVISLSIGHNNYTLRHPDPEVKLMGYVYGHGDGGEARTAYGFAAGYRGIRYVC